MSPSFRIPAVILYCGLAGMGRAALTGSEIAEALDSGPNIQWEDVESAWTKAPPGESPDGVDAVRTPLLGHGESASLSGKVKGPGTLTGRVRVSSERWHDALTVEFNAVKVESFSGGDDRTFTIPVPPGWHNLELTWTKDGSVSERSDAAWIDTVSVDTAEVSLGEAIDLAGTPAAAALTFITPELPVSRLEWAAIVDAKSHAGGDSLFATGKSGGMSRLQVSTNASTAASLVTFFSGPYAGSSEPAGTFELTMQGGAQVFSREAIGAWTRWRVLLPAGSQFFANFTPATGGKAGSGWLLDDWSVHTLTTVPPAVALDAPGLTITPRWDQFSGGQQPNEGWLACDAPLSSGLVSEGAGVIYSLPLTTEGYLAHSTRSQSLRTTLTGRGRLGVRWKMAGDREDSGTLEVTITSAGAYAFNPSTVEWREEFFDVPDGQQEVCLKWTSTGQVLLVDRLTWIQAPRAPVPPLAAEAADVSGLTLVTTGNWQPGQWTAAGFGNDDALEWIPGNESIPLTMTMTGPGWLSFAWRGLHDAEVLMEVDGVSSELSPLAAPGEPVETSGVWQHVAHWLPSGLHTVTLADWGGGPHYLDALSFSAAPPSWVEAVEGSGITAWQMASAPWTVVHDVTHDGTDALRVSSPGAGNSVALRALSSGPGFLKFHWRVNDPLPLADGANELRFYGQTRYSEPAHVLSGSAGWEEVVIDMPGAADTGMTWVFRRSQRATQANDGAWLDDVTFTPAAPVPLATALDTPGRAWNSGGSFQPLGGAGFSLARGGAVVWIPAEQSAWLETVLQGSGQVVLQFSPMDGYGHPVDVWIDGAKTYGSTAVGDGTIWFQIFGSGPHTFRMEFPSQGNVFLDSFNFTPRPLVPMEEALDLPAGRGPPLWRDPAAGLSDVAASHDGTDVVEMGRGAQLSWWSLDGPLRISFWWRCEGPPGSMTTATADNTIERTGPFGWEERTMTFEKHGSHQFSFWHGGSAPSSKLWVDQMRIEPYETVPLHEALHVAAGTVSSGGTGGQWRGVRPPGPPAAEDGAYAAAFLDSGSTQPAWMEARVTGPGLLHYVSKDLFGAALTVTIDGISDARVPLPVPPGPRTVRWSVLRTGSVGPAYPVMTVSGLRLVPTAEVPLAFDAPGLTFTSIPSPYGFWYGDARGAGDSAAFSDDSVVRVSGTARLETILTGPGWLQFEGEPVGLSGGFDVRLLPPPPAPNPDPLPWPLINVYRSSPSDVPDIRQNLWIPPGPWRMSITGYLAATLNRFRYTPAMDTTAAAAALDLAPGMTVSFPNATGAAATSPVSHDGTDALQLFSLLSGGGPLMDLPVTGPAVVSGWMRTAWVLPGDSVGVEPGVVSGSDVSDYGVIYLDGAHFYVAMEKKTPPDEWVPFRIPIPLSGPHVIGFGLSYPGWSSPPGYVLQMDELAVSPLAPVALSEALDTPALTWTVGSNPGWSGWASTVASPDATDAAWVLAPSVFDPPGANPQRWLETTVTGPGAIRFQWFGPDLLEKTLGGERFPFVSYYPNEQAPGTRWKSEVVNVPEGTHTFRLEARPASYALFGIDRVQWEPATTTTLAAGLDLPPDAVVNTVGPEAANWKGLTMSAFSHDGTDAVSFRSPLTAPTSLETTVTGPAMVTFQQARSGSVSITFTLDGEPLRTEGPNGLVLRGVNPPGVQPPASPTWTREEFYVPAGTHVLRWTVSPIPGNTLYSTELLLGLDELTVIPVASAPSYANAVDQPGWVVSAGRPDNIVALNLPAFSSDGADSVLITNDLSSSLDALTAVVPGPGLIRYRWRRLGTSYYQQPHVTIAGDSNPAWLQFTGGGNEWNDAWIVQPLAGPQEVSWRSQGHRNGYFLDAVSYSPGLSIGEATGAPELTWITSAGQWLGLPALPLATGGTRPVSAVAFDGGWIETSLTGPARLKFTADEGTDVLFDGLILHRMGGPAGTTCSLAIPGGSHRVRWQMAPQAGLRDVHYAALDAPDPVAEALDAPQLPWLFAGDGSEWQLVADSSANGQDALRRTTSAGVPLLKTVLPVPADPSVRVWNGGLPPNPDSVWWRLLITQDGPGPMILDLSHRVTSSGELKLDFFEYAPSPVSLTEALDAPGQVWETSPEHPFTGFASREGNVTRDNTDAVMAPDTGAWLRTTVTGPARVAFSFKGNGAAFSVDGKGPWGVNTGVWGYLRFELGAGVHVLRWEKFTAEFWGMDQFSVTPAAPGNSLPEALEHPGPWFLPEPGEWTVSTTDPPDGIDAAAFSGLSSSWQFPGRPLMLPVQGPGRLVFHGRMNGNPVVQTSGGGFSRDVGQSAAWRRYDIDFIPPGQQLLQWPMANNTAGEPAPALDQVSFTPYAPVTLADALDGPGLTFATNPEAPWTGYAAGNAAADGIDAAVNSTAYASWLDITVPAGAGTLEFKVCSPGSSTGVLGLPDGSHVDVPEHWKSRTVFVNESDERTLRFHNDDSRLWLDDINFIPAVDPLPAWLAAHGLTANADLNSDTDGVGQSLLLEFAFGLDPNAGAARDAAAPLEAGLPVFDIASDPESGNDTLRCRYVRRTGGFNLQYEVLFTETLDGFPAEPGLSLTIVNSLNVDWELVTVYDQEFIWWEFPEKRFGRVRVRRQP